MNSTNINTNSNMDVNLKEMYDGIDFVKNPDIFLYETCMGDDTDSLVGASYLKHLFGIEIGAFYDFNNIYLSENKDYFKSMIGIDMSLTTEGHKCWDNHIQLLSTDEEVNSACANINTFYRRNASSQPEYHKKYAGSTALQMFAYYDGKKPETVEAALIWICMDSGFRGHYNQRFKEVHNGYLEDLGLTWMIDILDQYTYEQLNHFMERNGMNSKIKLNRHGYLFNVGKWKKSNYTGQWTQGRSLQRNFIEEHLGFSIELPKEQFQLSNQLHRHSKKVNEINFDNLDKDNIISMAFTYTNQVEFTTKSKNLFIQS